MWLLNTSTFKLEEHYANVPRYAILSHCWEANEELSFGDMEELRLAIQKKGYEKVRNFCTYARKRRFGYVWVDTCCIDKKSSAELSEAINSMYKWYREATICYVYLYDVPDPADFALSRWHSRGWTLQELLAPTKLLFFDQNWKPLASRSQFARKLERVTGIPRKALKHFNPSEHCIAERLSWSARRETTRAEDRAYCLLGILEVNMPLLYGEGNRAFHRLQEEIMKVNTDMSLFLWQNCACNTFGMLAADPSCFAHVPAEARNASYDDLFCLSQGWSINNAGISMTASIQPYMLTEELEGIFALYLHQPHRFTTAPGFVIFLQETGSIGDVPTFTRAVIDGETWKSHLHMCPGGHVPFQPRVTKLNLTRQPLLPVSRPRGTLGCLVKFRGCDSIECTASERLIRNPRAKLRDWPASRRLHPDTLEWEVSVNPRTATGLHCHLTVALMDDVEILVCLGMNDVFQPLCIVLPLSNAIYYEGLDEGVILREYCRTSKQEYWENEHVITDSGMICVRGREQESYLDTAIGLDVEISDWCDPYGKYTATIDFRLEEFIRHYLPYADLTAGDSLACVPRAIFEKLRDIEVSLGTVRRKEFLLRSKGSSAGGKTRPSVSTYTEQGGLYTDLL